MLQTAPMISTCPRLIRLDFEDLTAFEPVTEQYSHFGLQFNGAIALEPSNPTFLPQSGTKVLMPLEHEMLLTASFEHPTSWVGAYVCGTGSVVLTAFDLDGNLIEKVSTPGSPCLGVNHQFSHTWQGQQLELNRHNIAKVMFHSSDPFIIDDFFFSHLY